jgi:ABC-2 type transport system ATP-binding protein
VRSERAQRGKIMIVLKVSNVTKEYEQVVALNDVSLEIEKGTIFGLLGPNGAGKTSLIRILTGITMPDKGKFTLQGTENSDFNSLSRMIGYLPEERGLYKDMKIVDQLEFFGRIKGLSKKETHEKINIYAEKIGIQDWLNKKASELSKGMQQMVQFVGTIFYEPSLIILDEPFTGLDPINSKKLQDEILNLQKEGKTIIFSTHRMEQVEEICENIALINKGQIILQGKISEIKSRYKKNIYKIHYSGIITTNNDFEVIEQDKDYIIVKDKCESLSANEFLKKVMEYVDVHSFVEILPTLSEIFIETVEGRVDE